MSDTINVRFDNAGYYHPAYGRLGRGKNGNVTYLLPAEFGERETIVVPVMDPSSKPPRKVGEKKVTRYKLLPETAEIIPYEDIKEDAKNAELTGEPREFVVKRPIVAGPEALERVVGTGRGPKKQSARERTTGSARKAPV